MRNIAFNLYLIFLISFFLRLSARIPALGVIRIDLLLVILIFAAIFFTKSERNEELTDVGETSRKLKRVILYVVITLPIVEWPGSVLSHGIQEFIKAVIFFYFTVSLVVTQERLKKLVYIVLGCQFIRIIEPLYLNITEGYWGGKTWAGGEFEARLAGAPFDIINPNELGYLTVMGMILVYYLLIVNRGILIRLISIVAISACLYALILTASRSAFLVAAIALLMMFWGSKRKSLFIMLGFIGIILGISNMSDFQRDRYLSIFSSDTKGAATAEGRVHGLAGEFGVALNRPIVGHGLGTSPEAIYNVLGGKGLRSHNLYLETFIELGFIGLLFYLGFLRSVVINIAEVKKRIKMAGDNDDFASRLAPALYTWAIVTLIFSIAQYGLSIYTIYLIAGLSVVLQNAFESHEMNKEVPDNARC